MTFTKKVWSEKTILQDALKYDSRAAWKKSSYGYEFANKNGWLEIACKHMKGGKGLFQKGYWTLDKCLLDAKKYKTKSEWRYSQVPNGFTVAKRSGWLETCCAHMTVVKKPNGYWHFYENCLKDAQLYSTLVSWEKNSPSAVSAARKNKWLNSCLAHIEPSTSSNLKWTKDLILEDARRYGTISEWREASPGAYRAAHRTKILKEVTSKMSSFMSQGEYKIIKFLLERDIEFESQKRFIDCRDKGFLPFDFYLPHFNLLIEFQGIQHRKGWGRNIDDAKQIARRDAIKKSYANKKGYAFIEVWSVKEVPNVLTKALAAIEGHKGRKLFLKTRILSKSELTSIVTLGVWTLEKCKADARHYNTKSEWAKNSAGAHSASYANGWVEECCAHMAVLWEKKWTLDACKTDAIQYKTKGEWQRNSSAAHMAAQRKGWITDCCTHMKKGRKQNGYWSIGQCKSDAKVFNTKSSWRLNSPSGYATAKAKGWIEECCEHMKISRKPSGYWTLERCVQEARRYKTKKAWRLNSGSSYSIAKSRGWLTLCAIDTPLPQNPIPTA